MISESANASLQPAPRKRRWIKRIGCGFTAMLVILLAIGIGVLIIRNVRAQREYSQVLSDLRAHPEPLTFDDLVKAYEAALVGPNQTAQWEEACAILGTAMRKTSADSPDIGSEFFAAHAETLARLHALAEMPGGLRHSLKQYQETGLISRARKIGGQIPAPGSLLELSATDDVEATIDYLCLEALFRTPCRRCRCRGANPANSICVGS